MTQFLWNLEQVGMEIASKIAISVKMDSAAATTALHKKEYKFEETLCMKFQKSVWIWMHFESFDIVGNLFSQLSQLIILQNQRQSFSSALNVTP